MGGPARQPCAVHQAHEACRWLVLLLLAGIPHTSGTLNGLQPSVRLGGGEDGLPTMDESGFFGASMAVLDDGVVAIGQYKAHSGGEERGAVWLVTLAADSSVLSFSSVSHSGMLPLVNYAQFGASLAAIPGVGGEAFSLLAVGSLEMGGGGMAAGYGSVPV